MTYVGAQALGTEGLVQLQLYVHGGGGYLGICAGALLAAQEAFVGCTDGAPLLGATTGWSQWDRSEGGAWKATVQLTEDGKRILVDRGNQGVASETEGVPAEAAVAEGGAAAAEGDAAEGGSAQLILTGGVWVFPILCVLLTLPPCGR